MKTFKILSGSLLALMLLCTTAFAAGPTTPVGQVQAPPRKLPVDLLVQYVEFFNCPCSLNQALDTEYVTDMIAVKVANTSGINGVRATLSVNYYDMTKKATVNIARNITLNANQWTKVIMEQKPLLIKKSFGVHASIHILGNFTDPNPANDRVVQKTCGQMVE